MTHDNVTSPSLRPNGGAFSPALSLSSGEHDGGVEWQIAVFCHNERRHLPACLQSIEQAVGGRRALITVIVNGSTVNGR